MGARRQAKRRDWPPNLYQQASGYFYYRSPRTGKVKGLGRDKPTAFQQARAANAHLAAAPKSSLVDWVAGIERLTLEKWMDFYVPLWQEESKPGARTVKLAERFIARIKAAEMAKLAIDEITTKDIAEYLATIKSDGSAINIRTRLHDIFRMAETKGHIEQGRNPVSATKPRHYQVKRERLSLEQFLKIRDKAGGFVANGMMLALLTGQRVEDITELTFARHRDGYLFITQGKTGHKLQQDTSIRLEAVGVSIAEVIRQCRDRFISKYMVHHTRAGSQSAPGEKVTPSGLSKGFSRARDGLGIGAQNEGGTPPTFHEIRSLAERLYKKEYGAEFAQAIMGHKHAKMTAEYDDLRGTGWAVVSAQRAK